MRYLLCIKYSGTRYYGWAKQPNLQTIQGSIEIALKKFFRKKINIVVASRTDRGVHANNQYAHFDIDLSFKLNESKFITSINKILPDDIFIKSCKMISENFSARYNVFKKTYVYLLSDNKINPFMCHQIYQYGKPINLCLLKKTLKLFVGEHDFSSFTTEKYKNNVRKIFNINVSKKSGIIRIIITGDSFSRHMVRMIIGNALSLLERKITIQWIIDKLNNPIKGSAKYIAPANGLYLLNIFFK